MVEQQNLGCFFLKVQKRLSAAAGFKHTPWESVQTFTKPLPQEWVRTDKDNGSVEGGTWENQ
jgi:hypothetical protein